MKYNEPASCAPGESSVGIMREAIASTSAACDGEKCTSFCDGAAVSVTCGIAADLAAVESLDFAASRAQLAAVIHTAPSAVSETTNSRRDHSVCDDPRAEESLSDPAPFEAPPAKFVPAILSFGDDRLGDFMNAPCDENETQLGSATMRRSTGDVKSAEATQCATMRRSTGDVKSAGASQCAGILATDRRPRCIGGPCNA